jgi:branched-chain amino acid transport system substrate-binding protein
LGDAAEGVIGVIPFNAAADGAKVALDYAKSKNLNIAGGESGYVQGWYTAAILMEGVDRTIKANKPVTGENIKASLEGLSNFETGGVSAPITFTATDHRGTRSMRVYKVQGGVWKSISDVITAK